MIELNLPHNIAMLLEKVAEADRPVGSELVYFWKDVAKELSECMQQMIHAREPQVIFNEVRQSGRQYIWEFFVIDKVLPQKDQINWHGQNTSQWVYAGCILLDNGQVSTHH